ncbi:hypothetical protein N7475_006701 [Penicillium sp. IBT 31633x]|nr:hypothetical protein N7475_006701 [Penicillium sp. IBT 31633x]
MANVSRFPEDLKQALNNTFTDNEVDKLLAQPGTAPRFVAGLLMLPTVLKYYLEIDQEDDISKHMTQAILHGHRLYEGANGSPPVLYESAPEHMVFGMVIFGLTQEQRNAIHKFEVNTQQHLASVQVEVYTIEYTRRTIEVGIFRSDPAKSKSGLKAIENCMWDPMPFIDGQSYQAILEAQETLTLSTENFSLQHPAMWDPIPLVGEHVENMLRSPETYGLSVTERDVSRTSTPNSTSESASDDNLDDEKYVKVPDNVMDEIGMNWLI